MYKALSTSIFIFAFTLMTNCSFAQFDIAIAGKWYRISQFREDSAFSFNNEYTKDGILPSIKRSTYDLEIRYYDYGLFGEGQCIVIRGDKDKLEVVDYSLEQFVYRNACQDSGRVLHKYDNPGPFRIGLHIRKLKTKANLDSLVTMLLLNHITDLADDDLITTRLKASGVKLTELDCVDCVGGSSYEVKAGKHFRNFGTSNVYSTNNTNIPEYNCECNLDRLLTELRLKFFK